MRVEDDIDRLESRQAAARDRLSRINLHRSSRHHGALEGYGGSQYPGAGQYPGGDDEFDRDPEEVRFSRHMAKEIFFTSHFCSQLRVSVCLNSCTYEKYIFISYFIHISDFKYICTSKC